MIVLILILLLVGIVLAIVDATVPVRPSWLLNAAVLCGLVAVLLMILTGEQTLHIDT